MKPTGVASSSTASLPDPKTAVRAKTNAAPAATAIRPMNDDRFNSNP